MLNHLAPQPLRPAEADPSLAWPQDILVPQDDGAASERALDYAAALAAGCGGTVIGVALSVIPMPVAAGYGDTSADAWLAAREAAAIDGKAKFDRIRPRFESLLVPNELRRVEVWQGEAGGEIASQARFADLVVIGQATDAESTDQRELLLDLLFYSGRPIIVAPSSVGVAVAPSRVLVAWQSTREATRALHDALPLLKRAEAVKLIVVDNGRVDVRAGEPGADAGKHLARHGVNVETAYVAAGGRSVADATLEEARYFGANLVVLGGYGHSPMRERIFGGVSRDIVERSTVPLLLSH